MYSIFQQSTCTNYSSPHVAFCCIFLSKEVSYWIINVVWQKGTAKWQMRRFYDGEVWLNSGGDQLYDTISLAVTRFAWPRHLEQL